jgi:hypothetical protein
MRALAITVSILLAQACLAGQQKALPEKAANTFTALALLVGEFYFFHHAWPTGEKQLREFIPKLSRQSPPDPEDVISTVWSQMHLRHVEFTPRGKDVLVRARFLEDGRDYSYAAVLHPGKTAEQIAHRMTPQ